MTGTTMSTQENINSEYVTSTLRSRIIDDVVLLGLLPLIAACGLIYEYSLSHYAGLVIGDVENAIFIMIGVMIMSAGFGSLTSQNIKCVYTSLAWIELAIIFVGATAIIAISGAVSIGEWIVEHHETNIIAAYVSESGVVAPAAIIPYLLGFVMGFLIGMEMPLVVRLRSMTRNVDVSKNTATVYAADCIGVALGTFAWAAILGDLNITTTSTLAATTNGFTLVIFYLRYKDRIKNRMPVMVTLTALMILVALIFNSGTKWEQKLETVAKNHQNATTHIVTTKNATPHADEVAPEFVKTALVVTEKN